MSKFTHTLTKYQSGKKLLKANLKNMEQSAQLQCQQNNDIVISRNFFFLLLTSKKLCYCFFINNMVSEHPLKAGKDLFDGPSFKATHE